MKTNAELDKWAAEKCGVSTVDRGGFLTIRQKSSVKVDGTCFWTLSDARCREIVRERFKLETLLGNRSKTFSSWICEYLSDEDSHLICGGRGDTLAKAEIECIQAIKDAEGE